MNSESRIIAVTARIDEHNQLVLTVQNDDRAPLRPNAGIEDLLVGDSGSITVEVTDFFQCGTVYDVYGATLGPDGHEIAAHWEATGRGRRARFDVSSSSDARQTRIVVGATPRRPGAPVPAPFTSWGTPGGSSPTDIDPGKGPVR